MEVTARHKVAYWFLSLSSWCKFIGKVILPNSKYIMVDSLTLYGWFIIDGIMIHQTPIEGKVVGFEWTCYNMPEEYIFLLNNLKRMK